MKFNLSGYIIPSVISMVVVGSNANIDGLFIGNIMGDNGLAAINIVWPIVAFAAAAGTGIAVGGAVMLNRHRGRGDTAAAETIKNTTMLFLLLFGAAASVLLWLFREPLLIMMGAEGEVLLLAAEYAAVIGVGAAAQICGAGVVVLLRNDGKTYQGMIFSVIGLLLHIALNAVLAGKFGMGGVAAATVISQTVVAVSGFAAIKKDREAGVSRKYSGEICLSAAAPFGLNFVPSLVLMFTNICALRAGGTAAVSAYAVMSYAVYTFDYIFQGVCDGVQPVISYTCGACDNACKRRTARCGAIVLGAVAAVSIIITPLMIEVMPRIFSVSDAARGMMDTGFIIYAFAYPFKAAAKYICAYYYACGERVISNILVCLDPLLLTPLFLYVGMTILGINGVWAAMTAAQFVLCIAGTASILINRRKRVG